MEFGNVEEEETLLVLDSSISRLKWRLRPSARRRLETDILALCTGLRPVVMVDYGGKMPELQEHLCALMHLAHKQSSMLLPLRVMVIEEMIYIIHIRGLAEHALSNPSLRPELLFVDLEQDPPKMLLQTDKNVVASEFTSIQKFFSTSFPVELQEHLISGVSPPVMVAKTESSKCKDNNLSCVDEPTGLGSSECIDLSSCMKDTHVTIPTLNGWLLGYPVVYLFGKEHIDDAVYNLSTKSLRIYKILICRNRTSGKKPSEEELMGWAFLYFGDDVSSFSVPYDLSMGGEKEPWAEAFLARMMEKFERCKHVWMNVRMEVSECYPQAIVL